MKGIRVLEVSQAVAGPAASQILADYGARVTKIERPIVGDIFRNTPGMGESFFLSVNRGKESVAIDLKTPRGLELFYKLAGQSDVIIENLSPGAAEKLGITYAKIRRANSSAIYCKIESFGSGPYQNRPAFDPVLQAATGIMSATGFPPNKFARAGVSIVDMSAAFHAVIAIEEMLLRREKTGKGGLVEVSLYDTAAYYMSYWITRYDMMGKDTTPLGSTHLFGCPYNLFKVRDGLVYIAIADDKSWDSFCTSLDFLDLKSDKRYDSNSLRAANKAKLEKEIGRRLSYFNTKLLSTKLKDSGVAFAKFNTAGSLLKDEHFKARNLLRKYNYGRSTFRTVVNPVMINGRRIYSKKSPPLLGIHSNKIAK